MLRERPLRWPLITFCGLLVALVLLRVATEMGLPLPLCGLREVTGMPCPGCGSTRAAIALGRGALAEACLLNPLATVLMVGSIVAFCGWLWDLALGTSLVPVAARLVQRVWGLSLVVLSLAANWLYLLLLGGR